MAECSVETCEKNARTRGWCDTHYNRWLKTGDVGADSPIRSPSPDSPCEVPECENRRFARGWCSGHYARWQRSGDVDAATPLDPRKSRPRETQECCVEACLLPARSMGRCKGHYSRWLKYGDEQAEIPLRRKGLINTCSANGCEKQARSKGLCPAHYQRLVRRGEVWEDQPLNFRLTGRSLTKGGYFMVMAHGHPLSYASGRVYEHRKILFDSIGEGEHSCHWCEKTLHWCLPGERDECELTVDHLDGDPTNNSPSNLVPACASCNTTRGNLGNPQDWEPVSDSA